MHIRNYKFCGASDNSRLSRLHDIIRADLMRSVLNRCEKLQFSAALECYAGCAVIFGIDNTAALKSP